jgi:molybdate transport system ATP-binding protein
MPLTAPTVTTLANGVARTASILLDDCRIGPALSPIITSLSWRLLPGEVWAVVGPSGGGKDAFAAALAGQLPLVPNSGGLCLHRFATTSAIVSFEAAAALLERERYNDDSDFVEGGVSEGTSVRAFIAASLPAGEQPDYPAGAGLEAHPAAIACGLAEFMDRGLKRLSTGECRRALLCRAVVARPGLIIAVEPYDGLDSAMRGRLRSLLDRLATAANSHAADAPALIIVDRLEHWPAAVNRVLVIEAGAISYAGDRSGYAAWLATQASLPPTLSGAGTSLDPHSQLAGGASRSPRGQSDGSSSPDSVTDQTILVQLRDIHVAWSGRAVLSGLTWTVRRGEHWLVRGPNGSGKTTLLELITGDNPQAYSNDVRVFGQRRGAGQTIWELKSRIGIVSYRLHLEYRYLDELPLDDVLISGLRDSIGLYTTASPGERELARNWLALAGFADRFRERFGQLSFGEQRCLLVARAAIKHPDLLVLDEPCHGLDEVQRNFVMTLMSAIAARGHSTIIHVTHDPDEVQSFERHVLELRPGESPAWAIITGPDQ